MKKLLSSVLLVSVLSTSAFANGTSSITADEMLTKVSGVRTDSVSLATGIYMIYQGVQNYKAKSMSDALTSGALGLSTALGAVSFISRGNAAERIDIKDEIKESQEYEKIADQLGEETADEFVLDALAGWSVERLHEKYNLAQQQEDTVSELSREKIKHLELRDYHQLPLNNTANK